MKRALFLLIVVFLALSKPGLAFVDTDDYFNSSHEQPVWFETDNEGGFFGETVDGMVFTQRPINNNVGLRLHKFMIGPAYFYISDRGIIRAESDLSAISIYFSLV